MSIPSKTYPMTSLLPCFKAYDIRGIAHKPASDAPVDLTPETVELIGKAARIKKWST